MLNLYSPFTDTIELNIPKGFDYNNIAPVRGVINGIFVENQNLELSIEQLNQ